MSFSRPFAISRIFAINLTSLHEDEGHGGEEGGEGHPEGGTEGVVGHDSAVTLELVVRLDVDDVVLADVVDGRVIDTLGAGEVHAVGHLVVALLPHDEDVLTETVDLQVAGHGDGLEERNLVFRDLLHAGAGVAQHRELHVVEGDGDDGVLTEVLVDEALLDGACHLGASEALHLHGAEHGEVDVAVLVDGVGIHAGAVGRRDVVSALEQVEEVHQLLVAAVDVDAELVAGDEANGAVARCLDGHVGSDVLQVSDVLGSLTRGEQECTEQNEIGDFLHVAIAFCCFLKHFFPYN